MSEVDGGYFCTRCQAFVDVIDADEHNQRCAVCKSYRVKWCPGSADREVRSAEQKAAEVKRVREASERFEAGVVAGTRVMFTPEFLEKKPRLPAAERDLRLLAQSGYYFCFGCLEVSKKAEGKCVLCGSEDVKWQGGIENVPEPAAANSQSPIADSRVEQRTEVRAPSLSWLGGMSETMQRLRKREALAGSHLPSEPIRGREALTHV